MLWCLFICHNTCECVLDGYLIVDLNNNIIMEFIYNLVLKNGPYRYLKKVYGYTDIHGVPRIFDVANRFATSKQWLKFNHFYRHFTTFIGILPL